MGTLVNLSRRDFLKAGAGFAGALVLGFKLGCAEAEEGAVSAADVVFNPNAWLEITVVEGRRQQLRRMLLAVGHPVLKLRRIRYGGVRLGELPPGGLRPLRPEEVARLRDAVRSAAARGRRRPGPGSS